MELSLLSQPQIKEDPSLQLNQEQVDFSLQQEEAAMQRIIIVPGRISRNERVDCLLIYLNKVDQF